MDPVFSKLECGDDRCLFASNHEREDRAVPGGAGEAGVGQSLTDFLDPRPELTIEACARPG
jgi:hypothetical protein